MGMSLDMNNKKKDELVQRMAAAMKSGDTAEMAKACEAYAEYMQSKVLADYAELQANSNADTAILASRGYPQLTSEETKYFNCLADAMKASDVKMALANIEVAMPKTTLDRVMGDVVQSHPLLDKIDFQNTNGAIKLLVNEGGVVMAVWGKLTDSKKAEINGSIVEIDAMHLKLLSYIPVPKALLDLGPMWLESYVRGILSESIALGMEHGIINGDGNEQPIGMIRSVGKNASIKGGVYSAKTAVKVKAFDKKTYGSLLKKISKNSESGNYRDIPEVLLIVNPADYFDKVMPATTCLTPNGTYARDVFPYPTTVIKSCAVEVGKAIFGIGNRYFMCLGLPKNGKIEYSDDVQFLDDNRVYLAKLYGNGLPLDDNAFIYLDISELEETRFPVTTWLEQPDADAETTATK